MGMTKWWSKSQPQLKKEDSKNSQNPTESSNKDEIVCNPSEAEPGTSKGKQAGRILDSLQKLEVILKDANISREDFSPQKLLIRVFIVVTRGDDAIEMAELIKVSWLDVSGSFDTIMLSPETLYEASFVVMVKEVEVVLWDTPAGSVHIQPADGHNRHGLSFVVMTENEVEWDTNVEQVPNVLLMIKKEDGTNTPVTFVPIQPDGKRNNLSFVVMMKNEDGTDTPATITGELNTPELSIMLTMKNDAGTISKVSFVPTQPDGSGHQLSFVVSMKNEVGQYTPVTFIPSKPDGSQPELSFALMMNNKVVWQTPVTIVPTLLDGSMHEVSFVVMMKNETGLDTLLTLVPTQPDGSRHTHSFALTMKNVIGWDTPVTIQISHSDGSRHEQKVKMSNLPKEQWVEIPVAKFRTFHENLGNMRIVMAEHKDQLWKRGFIFKGFKIQAKIA
ncbi:hypothetical protein TIFTF001_028575 [Ficus carica]|uniref:Uncharacterized protein n=1 Tax=Ficus carica TaxID=3494 RepID=A0AA88J1P3_FICCA|nr:hypothetical protein TIFTF001_028575 [Ficus carica]